MKDWVRKGKWLEIQLSKQEQGLKLEHVLKDTLGISGRMLQRLTRRKGIVINDKQGHLAAQVKSGDRLRVALFEREDYGVEPEPIMIEVLYEDDHLLIVNKPAGLSVHPTEPHQGDTLANALAFYYQTNGIEQKIRHVHRLDRDTSGTLLVAKHELAHSLLDGELREQKIVREYIAIVEGRVEPIKNKIDAPIGRDRHHPTRRRVSPTGASAVTYYEVIKQSEHASLVRLQLETGRTHQIRVHLSHLGYPIFGDTLYGGRKDGIARQALHSERIRFYHPFLKEEIEVIAPLPADMENLINKLGLGADI